MNCLTVHVVAAMLGIAAAGGEVRPAANRTAAPTTVAAETDSPSPEDLRLAVRQALPYLARQTGSWIEEKKCTSCHQVPHALWAMNEARKGGFVVDDRLTEWNRWSVAFVLGKPDTPNAAETRAREHIDEIYQLLLASAASEADRSAASSDTRRRLVASLHLGRDEDGSWHAGGRLPDQRRPQQETDEVTTMWSLLTLRTLGGEGESHHAADGPPQAELKARSTSLEHLMLRYLLARESRGDEPASALRQQILAHQNADGGWGWLLEGPSDALATGQALYALAHMERKHADDAVRRTHRFLLRTQQHDGSWLVPSTLAKSEGHPYVVSNDWGTAWAVIGLMRTMLIHQPDAGAPEAASCPRYGRCGPLHQRPACSRPG